MAEGRENGVRGDMDKDMEDTGRLRRPLSTSQVMINNVKTLWILGNQGRKELSERLKEPFYH